MVKWLIFSKNVEEANMSRIIICGLNGSGKTTLGSQLAQRINYIHKDAEDYYFKNSGKYKNEQARSKDEVSKEIEKDFDEHENIIFTSCKGDYGNISSKCDFAIYIRLDKDTRLNRVKERSYKQFGDRVLEGGDLYEKEAEFWNMVYNKDEASVENWFNELKCKKIIIDGTKEIEEKIEIIIRNIIRMVIKSE
jgi:adenylate kinase family enzyme